MKISKKPVTANTVVVQQIDSKQAESVAEVSANKYGEAMLHISAAIESLGKLGKDDEVAKESIANLSVVLLDLQ